MADELPVFERDDRKILQTVGDGLIQLWGLAESLLIQERYGLSVTFDEDQIEWTATDPRQRYQGTGNTPTAAIVTWDIFREQDQDEIHDDS